MTHEEFILEIRKAYEEARKLKFDSKNGVIKRGTSHTISSIAEDLLAIYCFDLLSPNIIKDKIEIWVDPQITFENKNLKNISGKKSLLVRPDICIIKNGLIVLTIDLKMDLGHLRKDFEKKTEEWLQKYELCLDKEVNINNGETKISNSYKFSRDLRFSIVVASKGNATRNQLILFEEIARKNDIPFFYLYEGHLNSYEKPFSESNIIQSNFTQLNNFITS